MRADRSEFPAELTVTRTGRLESRRSPAISATSPNASAGSESWLRHARAWSPPPTPHAGASPATCTMATDRVTTVINLQLAEQKWESAPQRAKELLGLALREARRGIEDLRNLVRDPPRHPHAARSRRGH